MSWLLLSERLPPVGEPVLITDGTARYLAQFDDTFLKSYGPDDSVCWDPVGI